MGVENKIVCYISPFLLKQNVSNELEKCEPRIMQRMVKESSDMDSSDKGTENPKQSMEKSKKIIKKQHTISFASGRKAKISKLKMIDPKTLNAFLDVYFKKI